MGTFSKHVHIALELRDENSTGLKSFSLLSASACAKSHFQMDRCILSLGSHQICQGRVCILTAFVIDLACAAASEEKKDLGRVLGASFDTGLDFETE